MIEAFGAVFGSDSERYLKHERWRESSEAGPGMKEGYDRSWRLVTKDQASVTKRLDEGRVV